MHGRVDVCDCEEHAVSSAKKPGAAISTMEVPPLNKEGDNTIYTQAEPNLQRIRLVGCEKHIVKTTLDQAHVQRLRNAN